MPTLDGVPLHRRIVPVIALLLLAPYCAEYLVGYQGVITNPVGLVVAVAFVAPIYGTAAVLIREVTRRAGRGWPTMLLLAAACGFVQAGLIDQSLFDHAEYAGTTYWATLATRIPGADVDAAQLLTFVAGHVIWSFGAPIAVVEACAPRLADRPWLGRPGLAVVAAGYVAGAAFFVNELVVKAGFHAAPWRLAGVAVIVLALVVAAFAIPRRTAPRPGTAPAWWWTGTAVLVLTAVFVMVNGESGWLGVAAGVLTLAAAAVLLLRWSGQEGWGRGHVLAAAGAPLIVYAAVSFSVPPLGAVRYVSSAVTLLAVLVLLAYARSRVRR